MLPEDAQMLQAPRTVEGRGGEGACRDSQRRWARHTIHCARERFGTGQLGSQSSGCRFGRARALGSMGRGRGSLGSQGWRITRHPAPEFEFLHSVPLTHWPAPEYSWTSSTSDPCPPVGGDNRLAELTGHKAPGATHPSKVSRLCVTPLTFRPCPRGHGGLSALFLVSAPVRHCRTPALGPSSWQPQEDHTHLIWAEDPLP